MSTDPSVIQVLYDNTLQSAKAQHATTKALLALSTFKLQSSLEPGSFALVSPVVGTSGVSSETKDYIRRLVECANMAAAALLCGSILAGHTSEADEYGDVAIVLGQGPFGPGHELDVLDALGLRTLTQDGRSPEAVELISPALSIPSTVDINASSSDDRPELHDLGELLKRLREMYVFCVERDHLAIYFLLGRYGDLGWLGLTGVGVHT
ncbi:hypothetical protein C8Q80DRAFT_1181188 [Daedaleopsis nitida]|nr:hypothetical protein C8Q80DRAFT_1181188 [Daedaleopsis nitida]